MSRCFFDSSSVAPIASGSIDSNGITARYVSLIGSSGIVVGSALEARCGGPPVKLAQPDTQQSIIARSRLNPSRQVVRFAPHELSALPRWTSAGWSPELVVGLLVGGALLYVVVLATPVARHRRQLAHDDLRIGDRRLAELRAHAPQRAHLRRAPLHRRERLLADLRPHARCQHGLRIVLSRRWLHRLRGAAEDDGRGFHDPGDRGVDLGVGVPRDRGRRHRRSHRPRRAAGVSQLESGSGAAPGTDHDRDLGDHRRPDHRPFQRWPRLDRDVAGLDEPARRAPVARRRLLARTARHALPRRRWSGSRSGCGCTGPGREW